jgi:hypothetical protein
MSDVFIRPVLGYVTGSKLTALDTYATCTITAPTGLVGLTNFPIRGWNTITLVLSAVTQNLHFKIDVSLDESVWVSKELDKLVIVGTPVVLTLNSESWNWMRILVKPAAAGVHGTGSFRLDGSTM